MNPLRPKPVGAGINKFDASRLPPATPHQGVFHLLMRSSGRDLGAKPGTPRARAIHQQLSFTSDHSVPPPGTYRSCGIRGSSLVLIDGQPWLLASRGFVSAPSILRQHLRPSQTLDVILPSVPQVLLGTGGKNRTRPLRPSLVLASESSRTVREALVPHMGHPLAMSRLSSWLVPCGFMFHEDSALLAFPL